MRHVFITNYVRLNQDRSLKRREESEPDLICLRFVVYATTIALSVATKLFGCEKSLLTLQGLPKLASNEGNLREPDFLWQEEDL